MQNNSNFSTERTSFKLEAQRINAIVYSNSVLLSIGIVGNLISFFVFLNKTLRKRKFNWYLLTLTVFKFVFCLFFFIDYILIAIHKHRLFLHNVQRIFFMIIDYTIHTSDCCAVVLTLLLSTERLYAIKNPMEIKEFFTNLHAKRTITVSLLLSIILKTLSYTFCELNFLNKSSILYCSIVSPSLFHVVPSVITLILNGMLAKHMFHVNYHKNGEDEIEMDELNAGKSSNEIFIHINKKKVSSVIIRTFNKREKTQTQKSHYIVIFVSSLWSTLSSILYYFFNSHFSSDYFKHLSNKLTILQSSSSIFFSSNHCINFFTYLLFYSEYRNILKEFFSR